MGVFGVLGCVLRDVGLGANTDSAFSEKAIRVEIYLHVARLFFLVLDDVNES